MRLSMSTWVAARIPEMMIVIDSNDNIVTKGCVVTTVVYYLEFGDNKLQFAAQPSKGAKN